MSAETCDFPTCERPRTWQIGLAWFCDTHEATQRDGEVGCPLDIDPGLAVCPHDVCRLSHQCQAATP